MLIGYSYALSPVVVKETVAAVPVGMRVLFDVDHWDSSQDDLRRFMELDPQSRRFWVQQSIRNARAQGASFEAPIDCCGGCTPRSAVIDHCETPPNYSPAYTEHNAVRCGDLKAIRDELHAS